MKNYEDIIQRLRKDFPALEFTHEHSTGSYLVGNIRLAYQSFKRHWEDYETGTSGTHTDRELGEQRRTFYNSAKKLLKRYS